jgi:hypothetical protein
VGLIQNYCMHFYHCWVADGQAAVRSRTDRHDNSQYEGPPEGPETTTDWSLLSRREVGRDEKAEGQEKCV